MGWAGRLVEPYRLVGGKNLKLKDFDPGDTGKLRSKEHAKVFLEKGIVRMAELQDMLYAGDHWGVLLIFQGMDAAGKDGVIKHVMSGINPQGCQVYSFQTPSAEELDHDYLWRTHHRGHYPPCSLSREQQGPFSIQPKQSILQVWSQVAGRPATE